MSMTPACSGFSRRSPLKCPPSVTAGSCDAVEAGVGGRVHAGTPAETLQAMGVSVSFYSQQTRTQTNLTEIIRYLQFPQLPPSLLK